MLVKNLLYCLVNNVLYQRHHSSWRLVLPAGRVDPAALADADAPLLTFVEMVCKHAHVTVGHQGYKKTRAFLSRLFSWSTMDRDVRRYCDVCEPCARNKVTAQPPFGFLHPLPTLGRPFDQVSMDFVVGLPRIKLGGVVVDSILTVTDYFSKCVILVPLSSPATALQAVELFFQQVVRRFGVPSAIVSDRNPKFCSSFWRALATCVGTTSRCSHCRTRRRTARPSRPTRRLGRSFVLFARTRPTRGSTWLCASRLESKKANPRGQASLQRPFASAVNCLSCIVPCEVALNASHSASTGLSP